MRILVVEDETGIAQFIHRGLSEAGYAVDVAQDGAEGAERTRSGDDLHGAFAGGSRRKTRSSPANAGGPGRATQVRGFSW